ncbi:type II toxin-antitoxin system prevent-host-death family antitoxin [Profundibacter sp.]
MEFVTNTELRKTLGQHLSQVRFGGKRFLIYRHKTEVAALVSVRDLDRLEEFDRKSVRQKELEYQIRADAWERAKRGEPGMVRR